LNLRLLYIATFALTIGVGTLSGCKLTQQKQSLFEEMGGHSTITTLTENFVDEISRNQEIFKYFERSDAVRFKQKFSEHICMLSGGPCEYTGDNMVDVHTGMNISEHDFNLGVELLINAMNRSDIPHTTQNKILATLVPHRQDIIYLE
jgi:hemoglobin